MDISKISSERLRELKKVCNRALTELKNPDTYGEDLFNVHTKQFPGSDYYMNVGETLLQIGIEVHDLEYEFLRNKIGDYAILIRKELDMRGYNSRSW
jgi:hypothetical protein